MKHKNLIKALEKAGCTITKIVHRDAEKMRHQGFKHVTKDMYYYICTNGKHKCDWYMDEGDEEVHSVQVMGINQHNDSMTDYFPGSWHDTIKGIVHMMTRD